MTRDDLVKKIGGKVGITQVDALKVLEATTDAIQEAVAGGEKVCLKGFLTFEPKQRDARMGRNPSTGAEVPIPARIDVTVKIGSNFKKAVNG